MNILKRINSVYENIAQKNKFEYSIKRLKDSKNAFREYFINEDKNSDEYLAANNPVKFIYKYLNKEVIDNAIIQNPIIIRLLEDNKLSREYNLKNVSSIVASHLIPTARVAHNMYYNIYKNPDFETYICLIQAALLHDIGKIFIPQEILNKKSKLSIKERQIVELHNRFGYEILKTTKLKSQVAHLAWEHHDYDNCFKKTAENQTLMISDIYCALREVRPYKKALNDIAAKTILYDMGANGKFDVGYIRYLCV